MPTPAFGSFFGQAAAESFAAAATAESISAAATRGYSPNLVFLKGRRRRSIENAQKSWFPVATLLDFLTVCGVEEYRFGGEVEGPADRRSMDPRNMFSC
ncbi:hypothetical protein [Mesorhizobium sp. M0019]|uniref:hypothetical protein n=1 Tax=Mesorhizobium sp. M0019 TaxID=2956845 RepID=UPI003336FF2A